MRHSVKLNATLNVIKQLCSIIFPLITIPYVTRVLGATNYGKYTFSSSIIGYFTLLSALGISQYAIREGARIRDDKIRFNEFCNEIFTINIISTVATYILLIFCICTISRLHSYALILIVQSFSFILATIGADWVNSIYEDYFYITLRYIVIQGISLGLLFVLVRNPDDYVKYTFVTTFASTGGNILNIFYIRRYMHLSLRFGKRLIKHLVPILILFANSIALTIYINSDITILGIFKSERDVGVYGVASKIYGVVKQLINAVIVVTLPRLSMFLGKDLKENYYSLLRKTENALISVLIPAIMGLFMMSSPIIDVIGGSEYIDGNISLKILSLALLFAVLGCYYSNCILIPCKGEKYYLIATIFSACLNIGANFYFIQKYSYNGAAFTTLLSELSVYVICKIFSKNYVRRQHLNRNVVISTVLSSIVIIFICTLALNIIHNNLMATVVSIVTSGIAYIILMILFNNQIVLDIIDQLKSKLLSNKNKK